MDYLIKQAIAYTDKQNRNVALDPITCEAYSFFVNCYGEEEWIDFIGAMVTWKAVKKMIDSVASVYEDRLQDAQQEW